MWNATVADTLRKATQSLVPCSESPRLDAELLLCKVLGLSRTGLWVRGDEPLAADNGGLYEALLERRLKGEPVAYLTGTREFWSLSLAVTPDVLVPRPETELLVEQALAHLPDDESRAVLDLGTGSGAIALALARERPCVRITAVDISDGALAVARHNAQTHGLTVDWRQGSWFDAVAGMRFDLIVSNPPYVSRDDPALARLAAEPLVALAPGPTGLESLEAIVECAPAHLNPRGWLLLEHGSTQAEDVARLLARCGFHGIRTHVDYSGKPRVTLATIHPSQGTS